MAPNCAWIARRRGASPTSPVEGCLGGLRREMVDVNPSNARKLHQESAFEMVAKVHDRLRISRRHIQANDEPAGIERPGHAVLRRRVRGIPGEVVAPHTDVVANAGERVGAPYDDALAGADP